MSASTESAGSSADPTLAAFAIEALPIAPSLDAVLDSAQMPRRSTLVGRRVVFISGVAIALAAVCALIARLLTALIGLVTNIAFYGRLSTAFTSPAGHHLGAWVVVVPAIGGLIVGCMARWGSRAIRGHGIPEAMEQVLVNESRIAPRIAFLKPASAAIAIGTGGPFGAEGPIIATGGALGSFVGQILHVTAVERKTLLAAGAAAGMAATFGSPLSAVILAMELLLFELRPRSLIPVALAAATATAVRGTLVGSAPVFPMPALEAASGIALPGYITIGALCGLLSVGVTRSVYAIEDAFDRLPLHWMWWPALGGIAVGLIGYFQPLTLGVGYANIEGIVAGRFTLGALLTLCVMKFLSWSIALGSGTSGGTLAPLFTIGGAVGGVAGMLLAIYAPQLGIDPRVAGLVGMAAMFAGASRAFLASIVFAVETTQQPATLLPLLGGCAAAYLLSSLKMRHTIMTEKIARRGIRVPSEYEADHLDLVSVGDCCSRSVVSINAARSIAAVRGWLNAGSKDAHHEGFPVIDDSGRVLGVVTRRDLLSDAHDETTAVGSLIRRPLIVVHPEHSLREAADHMVTADVGRLIVVDPRPPHFMIGIITRGDLLSAHLRRLKATHQKSRHLSSRMGQRPA